MSVFFLIFMVPCRCVLTGAQRLAESAVLGGGLLSRRPERHQGVVSSQSGLRKSTAECRFDPESKFTAGYQRF